MCELIKKCNALQHVRHSREQTLASLEMQLAQLQKETEATVASPTGRAFMPIQSSAVFTAVSNPCLFLSLATGDSEDAKRLRQLENRLDKAIIKCSEAHHIRKTYEIILQKLQEERLGFDNEIATLEKGIKQRRSDFKDLESMCNDAQLSRDMAKVRGWGDCGHACP